MTHITKAYATPLANADYFETDDPSKTEDFLRETGWMKIETREIKNRDRMLEGTLKRCSNGSKAQRNLLQAYYNKQA